MRRSNSYWTQLLSYFLITTAIIILILASILYYIFQGLTIKLNNKSVMDKLYQTSYSASFLKEAAVASTMQIYFDPNIVNLLYADTEPSLEVNQALNAIMSYINATNYIFSVSLYNGKTDTLLSSRGFSEEKEKQFVKAYISNSINKKADLAPIPRKLLDSSESQNPPRYKNVYTYIMFDYSMPEKKIDNAVIINIKEDWIQNTMKSMNIKTMADTFIIDSRGTVVNHPSRSMFLQDLASAEYVGKILKSPETSGYFNAVVEGRRCIVTYVTSSVLGWKFVNILPEEAILKEIIEMRNYTIAISAGILLLGLALSYFLSRKVYSPLGQLTKKVLQSAAQGGDIHKNKNEFQLIQDIYDQTVSQAVSLQDFKREKSSVVKEATLVKLLKSVDFSSASIEKLFGDLNIAVNTRESVVVIILQIDNRHGFFEANNQKDRSLLKYAIGNIASEIIGRYSPNEAVDIAEDHIAILLNMHGKTEDESILLLKPLLQEVQDAALQYLKLTLTAAIGCICKNILDAGISYADALNISHFRIKYGPGSILTYHVLEEVCAETYSYPQSKENQLQDAIKLGKGVQAHQICTEMISHAMRFSIENINETLLRLALAINTTVHLLGQKTGVMPPFTLESLIKDLNRMETIEQYQKTLCGAIDNILEGLEQKRSSKSSILVNSVIQRIQQNYADKNISLDSIAAAENMSPSYLGRVFRENTAKSVADYINEVRAAKAAELLHNSPMTVNEIADRVGFLSIGHFYTTFKKSFGMTPNDYRKGAKSSQL